MTDEEKQEMFLNNVGLVYKVVNNHWGTKFMPKEDLVQEGFVLLMGCIERYDPTNGAAFSTYSTTRIKYKLNYIVRKYMYGSIMSSSTSEKALAVVTYMRENKVSLDNACNALSVDEAVRDVATIILNVDSNISLDASVLNDKTDVTDADTTYLNMLRSDTDFSESLLSTIQSEKIMELCYHDFVNYYMNAYNVMNESATRQWLIIFLDTIFKKCITQVEISKILGVTPERVRVGFNKITKRFLSFIKRNRDKIFSDDIADFDASNLTYRKLVHNIVG